MNTYSEYKDYCVTEVQAKTLRLLESGLSQAQAAKELGINKRNVEKTWKRIREKAAERGFSPEASLNVQIPANQYNHSTTIQGKISPEGVFTPTQAWAKNKEVAEECLNDIIDGLLVGRVKAEKLPKKNTYSKACTKYIVGDHHHGMLAWWREVQANYDLKISESYFKKAMLDCMANVPDTEVGILEILGDFYHCENFEGMTHKSKHSLDTSARFPKMYETGAEMLRWAIEQLRRKHKKVVFVYCSGNHDTIPSKTVNHGLTWLYEKCNDVEIVDNTCAFIPYVYGENFFLTHHGDRTSIEKTYQVAIRSFKKQLLETKHHYGFTGHIHSKKVIDNGMITESFRILAPQDSYAFDGGFACGGGELCARVYDKACGYKTEYVSKVDHFSR